MRPPASRSLLVEHPALPDPFDTVDRTAITRVVADLDRTERRRVAVQLIAVTALLADFELWPGRSALRRAKVVTIDGGLQAALPSFPLPLSRVWAGLGGGESAALQTRNGVLAAVAELTGLVDDLVSDDHEPGFFLDGVIERLLQDIPHPLDAATARSLWMLRWDPPPLPEPGDSILWSVADDATARRLGAALWAAAVRVGSAASLWFADADGAPQPVSAFANHGNLTVVAGRLEGDELIRICDRSHAADGALVVFGRFPAGWNPPTPPVFDAARLPSHLAITGIPAHQRRTQLETRIGAFDPSSEADRRLLTRSAARLFAAAPPARGRANELLRVVRLLPEGLPTDLALRLSGCCEDDLGDAEAQGQVVVTGKTVRLPDPAAQRLDPLHAGIADSLSADDPRRLLHAALATGDPGELLAWTRSQLAELRAREVRQLLLHVAPGALGVGIQLAMAEACLVLADIHGARRAIDGVDPSMARPWRAWVDVIDRPPDLDVELPRRADLQAAPRACAEVSLVAVRRGLRWGGNAADEAVDLVRSAIGLVDGACRRWLEIRLAAQIEPDRLGDPRWRRSMTAGNPELVGLTLFERSNRATIDGEPRFARRLLRRVMSAEVSPGRLALFEVNLGGLELDEGRGDSADYHTLRAFRLFQAAGFHHRTWEVLHNLAVSDIDRLLVRRATERLDAIAARQNHIYVEIERVRLALARGCLEVVAEELEKLPKLESVADPRIAEALAFLHGSSLLLHGRAAAARPLLQRGGQEALAWLDLAAAVLGSAPETTNRPEDGWGIRRAADLVRRLDAGTGDGIDPALSPAPAELELEDAFAVAVVRRCMGERGWPDRHLASCAANLLDRHGLDGWASLLRWGGDRAPAVFDALASIVENRQPASLTDGQILDLLGALGIEGLIVRSLVDGRELWSIGHGAPGDPVAHGRLELIPLGGAPSFAAPWRLLTRLLDLVVGPEGTPDRGPARGDGGIDGTSPGIAKLRREVRRLATTRLTILVLGETGSGKEMVAREIHRLSGRLGELVSVNVAAIPSNLLEAELFGSVKGAFTGADRSRRGLIPAADGGTLFLDEVGDLDPALQVKLLRFLESGEVRPVGSDRSRIVDVRVVCATHRDLQRLIDQGRFRPDLFYRIGIANVVVPPLRKRVEDIPLLRAIFERDAADRHGLQVSSWTGVAEETLRRHDWPGNVRELRHTVEVAMARAAGRAIRPEHLPIEVDRPVVRRRWDDALEDFRRRLLVEALTRHGGNRSAAARELGISRQALLYQLKALKLK